MNVPGLIVALRAPRQVVAAKATLAVLRGLGLTAPLLNVESYAKLGQVGMSASSSATASPQRV